ncbi:alpha/beta hydrolase [Fulvivirga sp. M361]|nr:alpha/beta hydrolase [Fulvivirga sp. M361]
MEKFVKFSITIIAFISIVINGHAQDDLYPFEFQKTGKGSQSIIFIPGFACSGDVWNETRLDYEQDFTCYTLTMAGFAGVAPQPGPTFRKWRTGIADFIEQNQIDKPIIIGHSMGGGIAMALAAYHPQLISKIIVVDALPCLPALTKPSFKAIENKDCSPIISQMTSFTDEQFYQLQKQSITQLVADTSKHNLVLNWSVKSDRTTFAQMYCHYSNTDLREVVGAIQCPVLVLLESYFVNFKPAIQEQFKHIKEVNLQYATKGLHFIMYDDRDWYKNQLDSFIRKEG